MKRIFNWKSVLYAGIGLCVISALIFFCGFFTANTPSLMQYHQTVLNSFAWTGFIGILLCCLWYIPYVLCWLGSVVSYYRWRYC